MADETKLKPSKGDDGVKALLELEALANDGRPDLIINSVPKKTLKDFKDLARREFKGDYGITLKVVMEQFMTNAKEYDMITRIIELERMVSMLLSSREVERLPPQPASGQIDSSSRSFINTLDQGTISDRGG